MTEDETTPTNEPQTSASNEKEDVNDIEATDPATELSEKHASKSCCSRRFTAVTKCLSRCLRKYWKGLLAVAVLYSIGTVFSTVLQDEVQLAVEWFGENGIVGAVLFVLSFVVLLLIGVPATLMEIGAAFLFEEFHEIFIINTIGKNIARLVGFFIGKYLLNNWVQRNLLDNSEPIIKALGRLIQREPIKYSILWSFAYIPMWTQFYAMPVLGCPLYAFFIGTNIPGLLYTLTWTFVGIAARNTIEDIQNGGEVEVIELVATGVGVLFLFVSVGIMGRYIRKEIKKSEVEEDVEGAPEESTAEDPHEEQPPENEEARPISESL